MTKYFPCWKPYGNIDQDLSDAAGALQKLSLVYYCGNQFMDFCQTTRIGYHFIMSNREWKAHESECTARYVVILVVTLLL